MLDNQHVFIGSYPPAPQRTRAPQTRKVNDRRSLWEPPLDRFFASLFPLKNPCLFRSGLFPYFSRFWNQNYPQITQKSSQNGAENSFLTRHVFFTCFGVFFVFFNVFLHMLFFRECAGTLVFTRDSACRNFHADTGVDYFGSMFSS